MVCDWALGFLAPLKVIVYDAEAAERKRVYGTCFCRRTAWERYHCDKEDRVSAAGGYAAQSLYSGEDLEDRSYNFLGNLDEESDLSDMTKLIESSLYKRRKSVFRDCFEKFEIARAVLEANWDKVLEVATKLRRKSCLGGKQCEAIFRKWGKPPSLRKVLSMAKVKADVRHETNYYADMGGL